MSPKRTTPEVISRITLMHVEDDSIIQFHFKTIMEPLVKELFLAGDGQEGLDLYRKVKPDVIVTDIRTPNMDGLEMVEAIREEDQDIPIIVTSAYSDADYLLRSIELGVDKYVIKPFNQDMLIDAVSRVAESLVRSRQIHEANEFNRYLLDINPNFLVTVANGEIEYINRTFLRFMNYDSPKSFFESGKSISDFIEDIDGHQDETRKRAWLAAVTGNPDQDTVIRLRSGDDLKNGAYLAVYNAFEGTDRYVVSFTDITKLEDEKRGLLYQATTDHLTGAFNRHKFHEILDIEVTRSAAYGMPLSLIMFDIDDFKLINDEFGHDKGDEILVQLVKAVSMSIRKHDMLCRWGGEEFIVIVPGCDSAEAFGLAEKLRERVCQQQFGALGSVTCSFGVAQIKPDEEPDELIRRVDEAMYGAKREGKNTVVLA